MIGHISTPASDARSREVFALKASSHICDQRPLTRFVAHRPFSIGGVNTPASNPVIRSGGSSSAVSQSSPLSRQFSFVSHHPPNRRPSTPCTHGNTAKYDNFTGGWEP